MHQNHLNAPGNQPPSVLPDWTFNKLRSFKKLWIKESYVVEKRQSTHFEAEKL